MESWNVYFFYFSYHRFFWNMTFLLTIILGYFPALIFANFTGAQTKGRDTERKNDINSIYQKLEEHYNENGYYPSKDSVINNGIQIFPGIDSEAFVDPKGNKIGESGGYVYEPYECDILGCNKYSIYTQLEGDTTYKKESLN